MTSTTTDSPPLQGQSLRKRAQLADSLQKEVLDLQEQIRLMRKKESATWPCFAFGYDGPKSNFPMDSEVDAQGNEIPDLASEALNTAQERIIEALKSNDIAYCHEYAWPDGSLYIKIDATQDDVEKLIRGISGVYMDACFDPASSRTRGDGVISTVGDLITALQAFDPTSPVRFAVSAPHDHDFDGPEVFKATGQIHDYWTVADDIWTDDEEDGISTVQIPICLTSEP